MSCKKGTLKRPGRDITQCLRLCKKLRVVDFRKLCKFNRLMN